MKKGMGLKFNDPAPDGMILSPTEGEIPLSRLWRTQPLLLAFLRHFGCPQCKQILDLLEEWKPALEKKGLAIAVITQASPDETKAFCAERAPGICCFSDPDRKVYSMSTMLT
jgi:peroxiredoxin